MNIQAINFSNFSIKNNLKVNQRPKYNFKNDSVEFSSKPISFGGIKEQLIRLEVFGAQMQAETAHKDASKLRDESFEIRQDVNDIRDNAYEILKKAPALFKEIDSYLAYAHRTNYATIKDPQTGEVIRDFFDIGENQFSMEEYRDGWNFRKTIITDDYLFVMTPGSKNRNIESYMFDRKTGELLQYANGLTINDVKDSFSAKEHYLFDNGKILCFDRDYKVAEEKFETSGEKYEFEDDVFKTYYMNFKIKNNGEEQADEIFEFENRVLSRCQKGVKIVPNESKKMEEEFIYDSEGSFVRYSSQVEDVFDKGYKAGLVVYSGDNGVERVEMNRSCTPDFATHIDKVYYFTSDKVSEIAYGFTSSQDGEEICLNKIKLK